MRKLALGALAALLIAPIALAEDRSPFQVAAFAGFRAGGSLEDMTTHDNRDLDEGASFALALEFRAGRGDDRYAQLWYSRQGSSVDDGTASHDVTVEYIHVGGTVPIGDFEKVQAYLVAGLGATHFSASGVNANDRTKFSGSLGFGLELPVSERAAFRLEARGYLTGVDTNTSLLCRSDNGTGFCRIVAHGSGLFQAEALAGFAFRF